MRPIATNINYRTVGRDMTQIGRVVLKSSRTENLKPEDGIILGRALAMDHKKVLVGRDSSSSSAMMANSVISGLLGGFWKKRSRCLIWSSLNMLPSGFSR